MSRDSMNIDRIVGPGDVLQTYPIGTYTRLVTSTTASALFTPSGSKVFLVYHYHIVRVGSGTNNLQVRSAATNIGIFNPGAAGAHPAFASSVIPLLIGRAVGEALNLAVSAADTILVTMTVGEGTVRGV